MPFAICLLGLRRRLPQPPTSSMHRRKKPWRGHTQPAAQILTPFDCHVMIEVDKEAQTQPPAQSLTPEPA